MFARFVGCLLIGSITSSALYAQSEAREGETGVSIGDEYVICPVTTELQRSLLQSDTVAVCVSINGGAFRDVETIDRFLPAFKQLQKELTELPKAENTGIVFRCIDGYVEGEEFESLKKRLESLSRVSEEVGYYAGYLQVKSSRTFHADEFDWQKWIDEAQAAAKAADSQAEDVMGNERVQVFFVRTFLSHLIANADCIVTILPVVRSESGFPAEFMPDLEQFLLPEKDAPHKEMLLQVSHNAAAAKQLDAWVEDLEGRREFARKFGFEGCNVSLSPTSERNLLIKVVDNEGKPIEGARVFCNHRFAMPGVAKHNIENKRYESNAEGKLLVTLSSGSVDLRLWVSKPGYVPLHAMWSEEIQHDIDEIPEMFQFQMNRGTEIGGVVLNDAEEPIAGATVEIEMLRQKDFISF